MSKFSLDSVSTKSTLCYVISAILKMLHPFMPYVTDEIYSMLPIRDAENIMVSSYPLVNEEFNFDNEEKETEEIIGFIAAFRNVKQENAISKDAKVMVNFDNSLINKMLN